MISSKFKNNKLLKSFTTYCIGGPAQYFFVANNIQDLIDALVWCKGNYISWFLLGGGSNVLISDEGFPGLVIKLGKDFNYLVINDIKKTLNVGGAVKLPKIGMSLANKGWGGFEFMCGIPGTVGAAVRINAGTRNGEIQDNLISAEILTPDLDIKTLKKNEMDFSYRYSNLIDKRIIVLEAQFSIRVRQDTEDLKKKVSELIFNRKLKQPKNKRNCGSIFKNPPGKRSAGWYIEQVDSKGMRMGDAQVSFVHSNWIVNLGNAKAQDVKKLIRHIQQKVSEKFGILLEREVIYVPEDVL